MQVDPKLVILALADVCFLLLGQALQKYHGNIAEKTGGNQFLSIWVVLSAVALIPTFLIPLYAYSNKMGFAAFTSITSVQFIGIAVLGYVFFGEPLNARMMGGFFLIVAGVVLVLYGAATHAGS
jgi:drug/metabolite transporter (DMT)-like permease